MWHIIDSLLRLMKSEKKKLSLVHVSTQNCTFSWLTAWSLNQHYSLNISTHKTEWLLLIYQCQVWTWLKHLHSTFWMLFFFFYNHQWNEGSILDSNVCPHFVVLWNPHFKVEKRCKDLIVMFVNTLRSFVPESCDCQASIFVATWTVYMYFMI